MTREEAKESERAIDEYFAWFYRERELRLEEARKKVMFTLESGGVVREIAFGGFKDWEFTESKREGWGWGTVEALAEHILNRHEGFGTTLQFDPVIRCVPFSPAEAVERAKAAGFGFVKTFGGWVAIDEWAARRENYHVAYEYDAANRRIYEIPLPERHDGAFLLGLWPVGTLADTADLSNTMHEKEVIAA